MRILTGLIRPDSGPGRAAGAAVRARRPEAAVRGRRADRVAVVLPVPVRAREPARARGHRGAGPAGRIDELLELVNLRRPGDGQACPGYSLGMKQRLGIAAALLNDPQLLLLDEPANGLDPAGIVGMRDSLRALAAAGKTVFVSSHILSEVQQLADVVGIIAPRAAGPRGLGRDAAARGGVGADPGGRRTRCPPRPRSSRAWRAPARSTPRTAPRPAGSASRSTRPRSAELNRALARVRDLRVADRGRRQPRVAVPRADRVAPDVGGAAGPMRRADRAAAAHGLGQRPGRQARADRVAS